MSIYRVLWDRREELWAVEASARSGESVTFTVGSTNDRDTYFKRKKDALGYARKEAKQNGATLKIYKKNGDLMSTKHY